MSSYAAVASHGPPQAEKDKKAHAVPELNDHSTVDTSDVTHDGQAINVVPADFKDRDVKTESQAAQHDRDHVEAEVKAKAKATAAAAEAKAKAAAKKTENVLLALGKDARTYNVIDSLLLVTLSVVGVRKYRAGTLDLQTASAGVAGLVLFAGVQGFVQKWFGKY